MLLSEIPGIQYSDFQTLQVWKLQKALTYLDFTSLGLFLCFDVQNNFMIANKPELVKTGKLSEINKQFHVK